MFKPCDWGGEQGGGLRAICDTITGGFGGGGSEWLLQVRPLMRDKGQDNQDSVPTREVLVRLG